MNRLSILCVAALCGVLMMALAANAGPAQKAACCQPACQPACEQPAPPPCEPACEPACQPAARVGVLARLRARCEARKAAKACCAPAACEEPKACCEAKPACEAAEACCPPECAPRVHRCRLFTRHRVVVADACCQAAEPAPAEAPQPAAPAEKPKAEQK